MAKPIIEPIEIFDANFGTTVYFSLGNLFFNYISEYEYRIYDCETGDEVYDFHKENCNIKSSFGKYSFFISTDAPLTNRKNGYYIKLRVREGNDLVDAAWMGTWSDSLAFYCKEKPTLSFMNLDKSSSSEINAYAAVFEMEYTANQDQVETLKNYQYHFYDSKKDLIESSDVYYGSISKTFSQYGLQNNTTYYVRGTGTTKNGYELDTGYYEVNVKYSEQIASYALEAENNLESGSIQIASHFVSIEGIPTGDYSFTTDYSGQTSIDLSTGSSVIYNLSGDNRPSSCVIKYVAKALPYVTISRISFEDGIIGTLTLQARSGKIWASLVVNVSKDIEYYIQSNSLDYDDSIDYLSIVLTYKNNDFSVNITAIDNNARMGVK